MAEATGVIPRGAEISERSSELVLPADRDDVLRAGAPAGPGRSARTRPTSGQSDRADSPLADSRACREQETEASMDDASRLVGSQPGLAERESRPGDLADRRDGDSSRDTSATASTDGGAARSEGSLSALMLGLRRGRGEGPGDTPAAQDATAREARGTALPGDRGPRRQISRRSQRPSFWRRIALGRRASSEPPRSRADDDGRSASVVDQAGVGTKPPAGHSAASGSTVPARSGFLTGRSERSTVAPGRKGNVGIEAIETRIVEPMLQALVSVEAKLERSHSELVGRSDQVEERLTQLWDIEEQLGALGELQESLLQVSEQQRRLESALVSQTRTIRWLVGAVFVSLAAAAFVVAALLR